MSDPGRLLLFSAPSRAALSDRLALALTGVIPPHSDDDAHRLAIATEDDASLEDTLKLAIARLKKDDKPNFNLANKVFYAQPEDYRDLRRTAFLFPGFGARHPSMVADLLAAFPAVRAWFDGLPEAARIRFSANALLFPAQSGGKAGFAETIDSVLAGTLAMHALLSHYAPGLACDAMLGHSYGETALLLTSGMVAEPAPVLDLLDGLVACIREADPDTLGAATRTVMLAVTAASKGALDDFRAHDAGAALLALDNCPQQAILCVRREAADSLEQGLRARGNLFFRLPDLSIPVHTPLFPVAEVVLADLYAGIPLSPPKAPAYSCATVAPFPAEPAAIRTLLAKQWTQTARFRETVERLYADGVRTFVEVGPGGHLAGFVRDTLRGKDALALATNLENRDTLAQLRCCLAQLFVRGHSIDAAPFCAPATPDAAPPPRIDIRASRSALEPLIRGLVAEIMDLDAPELIDPTRGFFDLGMGSLQAVDLVERLQTALGRPLAQTLPFDYPSITALAAHLSLQAKTDTATARRATEQGDIAIIGMGCRFPGSVATPEQFWTLLDQGIDALRPLPEGRWERDEMCAAGVDPDTMPHIFRGGFLDEIRDFDCAFFGIAPREAITLDPQQRLLLEVSREALEHAGIAPGSLRNSATGVFVGISSTEYAARLTMAERLAISGYIGTGNAHSTAAGRLSFIMGLNGPCLALDTACSSSLVAVHLACRSLREGESRLALAAGVNLMVSPETSIFLARAGALSRDSRCKTFDDDANGYVRSEGCGVVVLKRLADAQADGDPILAVIRGSAINHDGRTSGFTVPNGPAQQAVIRQALADAGVAPDAIDYVEAHGTGTALGDPIEVHALGEVFAGRAAAAPLLLGSVKTNIGHLEAAAGLAGLIKVVLQLQHEQIARSLHFNTPNARIGWQHLPVKVAGKAQDWPRGERPRLAGLSSFGISGSNAHVVIGEAPPHAAPQKTPRRHQLLTLSAASPAALDALAAATSQRLAEEHDFADLCATSQLGRDPLRYRLALVATDRHEAREALANHAPAAAARRPKIAFLFSGQGAQVPGMGHGLYEDEPVFRSAIDECAALLRPHLDADIRDILFGGASLDATGNAQPALFTLQVALCRLWQQWGLAPDYLLGHSIGEYAAACAAGVFSLADGARLVAARGRLMQSLPTGGAMLAVALDEATLAKRIDTHGLALALAAINGAHSVVLSGAATEIAQAEAVLTGEGVRTARLSVSHAFHSPLMDPIVDAFHRVAATVQHAPARIPLISTLSGARIEGPLSAEYWSQQLRQPVRFADGIRALRQQGCTVFLEIGPRPVLINMARADCAEGLWLGSLQSPKDEQRSMLGALASLVNAGFDVDWGGFNAGRAWCRAPLPATPFERQRMWIERNPADAPRAPIAPPAAPPANPPQAAAPKPTVIARLRAAPIADRPATVEYALRRMLGSVLGGAKPESLDAGEPLNRLGLDSLMALGLRNELATELGFETTLAQLAGDETIETLTVRVLSHLFGSAAEGTSAVVETADAEAPEHSCALSYGQRALWFLWEIAPDSSAYALSLPLDIPTPADTGAWQAGCRALVACHPLLRSIFPQQDGEPHQEVQPPGEIDWQSWEASTWSEADVAAAHAAPFDLEKGPVIRFRWFARPQGGARLLITMHHIVSDGWSLELIRRQLPGLVAGAELPVAQGYHAHVRQQLQTLQGPEGARLWHYWRERLSGPLPVLDLPTDFPRPPSKSYRGAGYTFSLSDELGAKLKALAREAGATSYVVFLAGFLALLHRYCGQDDVLVGSPHSGRSRPELAHLVGYFTDPLLIRSRLTRQQSFRDFLGATRQTVLEALEHADFPFALLVERLKPERHPSRSPLFDASFNFTAASVKDGDGAPTVADLSQADGKFDLTLNIRDGASLSGWFGFDTALFQRQGIERLCRCFIALLEAACAEPDRALAELPLAPGGAYSPALCGRTLALGEEHLVPHRIAAAARATPHAPALVAPDATLNYAELDGRARRLAGLLHRQGIGPGALVGVEVTRTAATLVAMLAIHEAGAAYVPLDPAWPPELRTATLARAGIVLPSALDDLDPARLDALPDDDAGAAPIAPDDLAYLIFTSGSTGAPKGVAVTHRALANYVASMSEDLGFAAPGHFALVSTLAADLGLTMLFPALCGGGCLHLLPEEAALDGERFAEYLEAQRIDYLKIVPSHLAALTAGRVVLPRRVLVLGGEPASPEWVAQLQHAAPACRIINHYGPTETTIGVLTGEVSAGAPSPTASLPLRRAVANSEIHLLDRHSITVPPGAIGEVFIGGVCLARGYVGAPEQDSFVTLAGRRLYRTGDLARQLPDGAIEILGRSDRQVKIRGFRIEPGQIEDVLRAQPGVDRCLVTPDADGSKATRLLAFFVGKAEGLADEALRQALARALPAHMVPERIIPLAAFPLTPNGKADVAALRRLAANTPAATQQTPPRDSIELELARLWADVLGVDNVGIDDDFFRLGGHSLLAVRLLALIQKRFGRRISLAVLLTHPTVETLSSVLRAAPSAGDHPLLVALRAEGTRPPLFLLPGAGGSILYFVPLAHALPPDLPVWALQAVGHGDNERIPECIEEIAARYVTLLRGKQPEGPYFLAGHSFGALVAFEITRLLQQQGQAIAFLGLIDNAAPLHAEPIPQRSDSQWLHYIARRIAKLSGTPLELAAPQAGADYASEMDALVTRLVAARLLPAGIGSEHFARFIDIYKANAIAASQYRPEFVATVATAVVFRATVDDPDLDLPNPDGDPTFGWHRLLATAPTVEHTPGTHLTMFTDAHAKHLAARIATALGESPPKMGIR